MLIGARGRAPVTRRDFLQALGRTAGAVTVYEAMGALELTGDARMPRLSLTSGSAGRARVIVLGAGLSGLATAYELQKLGHECRVLEARPRVGGRCFTVRGGTRSEETEHPQEAAFDAGLYLNAGPARIPHHHTATLDYCRELGVPLEAFCSVNDAAFVHQAAGAERRRLRLREVRADWRGHTAELLAKAVTTDALDALMSAEDRDRFLEWLKRDGALGADMHYAGTSRRGYRVPPGAGRTAGVVDDPLGLSELLRSAGAQQLSPEVVLQPPMFQVVGGMDNLARALASRVPDLTLGARVLSVEQPEGGVRVAYEDADGKHRISADLCVCTLPLPALRRVSLDVRPEMRRAIDTIAYSSAGKIGLQFSRRFWEDDEGIYGGITRTDLPITQILYPSHGFLTKKGVLVGYYQNGEPAAQTGRLRPAERLKQALEQGAQIHPQYAREFETGFSVAWQHVAHTGGGWAQYTEAQRRQEYLTLIEPDRALYLAGDHLTHLSGWMAGAFASARSVVAAVHERASRSPERLTATARG